MSDWKIMKNKVINECLDQPLLTSLFIADFAILLFHRPPLLYSLVMMGALIAMAMYFGQKLALFDLKTAFQFLKSFNFSKSTEKAVAEAVDDVKEAVSDIQSEIKETITDVKAAVADAVDKPAKPAAKSKTKSKTKT